MTDLVGVSDLVQAGVPIGQAPSIAQAVNAAARPFNLKDPHQQVRAWTELCKGPFADRRVPLAAQALSYSRVYAGRNVAKQGPGPAWVPSTADEERANVTWLAKRVGAPDYEALHRWSTENRDEFWKIAIERLGIPFQSPPTAIRDPASRVEQPRWLPGARLNIATVCFRADPAKAAIVFRREGERLLRRVTYGELRRMSDRVAAGIDRIGLGPDDPVVLYLPMTAESVAAYLGVLLSGRPVVGVADASAAADLAKRIQISGAKLVITVDSYTRDGKRLPVYSKAVDAQAPRTVVLPAEETGAPATSMRPGDSSWEDFLGPDATYTPVIRGPDDATNLLFSSGTTKDPKAIVWTQTTPIKALMDAHFHHDVHGDDVLAWPTSFGWMMGPWLTYAALGHGATLALYNGLPTSRGFAEFVRDAGVTMLGVVPKIVRSWKTQGTLEGLDWTRIRRFSSTGETSDAGEMLYLMHSAGWRPVIEYCGGTEIGGGYVTGTMVQPAAPATFTTPSLGLDFVLLDDEGRPADRGEVGLIPPSIGLSNRLLNYDHEAEYFAGFFRGPQGQTLRRHGDQLERLGRSQYKHQGRIDDMVNVNGVKTSVEELRGVLAGHPLVYDTKPISVDVMGSGQRFLVVYAVPRDKARVGDEVLRRDLRAQFSQAIKERLNPLLAHVHDVVLVADLPQAGPGKTRTQKEFVKDYMARRASMTPRAA